MGSSATKVLEIPKKVLSLHSRFGTMAEWLGTGLQNLLQRFDSAWYLQKCLWTHSRGICFVSRRSTCKWHGTICKRQQFFLSPGKLLRLSASCTEVALRGRQYMAGRRTRIRSNNKPVIKGWLRAGGDCRQGLFTGLWLQDWLLLERFVGRLWRLTSCKTIS